MNSDTPIKNQSTVQPPQEREISLAEILLIIQRRKFGILAIMLLALSGSMLYHFSEEPEYRAESVMLITGSGSQGDLLSLALGTAGSADNQAVKKDVELLTSKPIAELAVKALYKNTRRDSLEFFGKRPYYSPVSRFFAGLAGVSSVRANPQPGEWNVSDERTRFDAIRLNNRILVQPARETNVLKVSVASPFPDESAFLTDVLCQVYKDADISRNSEKYTQSNRFIAEMLDKQESKVAEADQALSRYMETNEIYEPTGNTAQLLQKLVESEAKYKTIQADLNITQNNLAFLEKKLTEADLEISDQIEKNVTGQLGAIMDELKGLESDYVKLVREKGIDNAETRAKRKQLDVVKTRYEQLSRSKIAGEIGYAGKAKKFSFDMVAEKLQIQRKLNELRFSAGEFNLLRQYYENQLVLLPERQQEYVKLQRDREVVSKTYLYLKEKLDETRIMLGSEVGGVSIIGAAFQPFAPEKPSLQKNLLMGLVLGALLAALYIFAAEQVDDTIKDESFFREIGLPLLSFIPLVSEDKKTLPPEAITGFKRLLYNTSKAFRDRVIAGETTARTKRNSEPEAEIPMPMLTDRLSSVFSESFRTLRTAIDYSKPDSPLKSILISGTSMSEGKSTVCSNLGMAFALTGKKTLVIDCDFRRASIHKKFNGKREKGLTDYLFGKDHVIDENWFQKTHVDNLTYLSAGKMVPNPNELLGSVKMLELIKTLEEQFDKVLIDSPPLFLSDAAQLAHSIDGILLVSRLHYTSRKPILEFAKDHFLSSAIIGIAVIGSKEKRWYGYGYGKYGYGKYGYNRYGYGAYEEKA